MRGPGWLALPARGLGRPEGLARAKSAYAAVAHAISHFEPVVMAARPEDADEARQATGCEVFEVALDDSWARDIGPTFVTGPSGHGAAVQWRFNAWGSKYHPVRPGCALSPRAWRRGRACRCIAAPIVCEGGAIHSDGEGTLLTTEQCLLNPNRNPDLTQRRCEQVLRDFVGAQRVIWLGEGFSDSETDGHVDNIACFAGPGRVIVGVPDSKSHPDHEPVMEAKSRLKAARRLKSSSWSSRKRSAMTGTDACSRRAMSISISAMAGW